MCFAAALSLPLLSISIGQDASSSSIAASAVTELLPSPTPASQLPVIPVVSSTFGSNDFTALNFSLVPPVPTQLVDQTEGGNFVDMSELLSDHMGVLENKYHPKSANSK